jgi:hypothetical protein
MLVLNEHGVSDVVFMSVGDEVEPPIGIGLKVY